MELLGKILSRIRYTTLTTIPMAQQEPLELAAVRSDS